jgi:hypothetical protein
VRTVNVALVVSGTIIVISPLCVESRKGPPEAIEPSNRISPLTVLISRLLASTLLSVMSPLVDSAVTSPVPPVIRMPSLTELALMRPFASSSFR